MANYRYQVRNTSGQVLAGVIAADNATVAATLLRNQGMHVLALSTVGAAESNNSLLARFKELNGGRPNQRHVLDFTSQLAVMMRAGINLRAALEGIGEQT